jgi:hypothetical protein
MKKFILYSFLILITVISVQLTRILLNNQKNNLKEITANSGAPTKVLPPAVSNTFISLKGKDKKWIKDKLSRPEAQVLRSVAAGLPKNTVFVTNLRAVSPNVYSRSLGDKVTETESHIIYETNRFEDQLVWSSIHLPVVRNKGNDRLGIFTGEVTVKYKNKKRLNSWLKKQGLSTLKSFSHLNVTSFRLKHNSRFSDLIESLSSNSNIPWFNLDIQFGKEKAF